MDRRIIARTAAAIGIALLAAVVAGCSSVRVTADWAPDQDFAAYRSFGWLHGEQPQTGDIRVDNPLIDGRIRAAIDRELEARGYQKVADAGADFLVGYHLSLETRLDVYTMNAYYGYGSRRRWGSVGLPETHVSEYEQGVLVIDIADTRRRQLVWRGTGTRRVSQSSSPEESTRGIDRAVAEILARFPPR